MLRDYEILYVVRPELDETQLGEAIEGVNKLIQDLGGTPTKTDVWGRRRLAYEVKHLREGQYVLQLFAIDPKAVPEMETALHISESVFRHLVVRRPEKAPAAEVAPATIEEPVPAPAEEPVPDPIEEPVPAPEPADSDAAPGEPSDEGDGPNDEEE